MVAQLFIYITGDVPDVQPDTYEKGTYDSKMHWLVYDAVIRADTLENLERQAQTLVDEFGSTFDDSGCIDPMHYHGMFGGFTPYDGVLRYSTTILESEHDAMV